MFLTIRRRIVRGTVSISALDAMHQVVRLADLQDGDYFGEVEMVNKRRRRRSHPVWQELSRHE